MRMQKNQPDFIGIGADHAELGLVASLLAAHPGIVTPIPATHFFSNPDYQAEALADYEASLPRPVKGKLRGECSSSYLTTPQVADRIVQVYPTTKLFVVVRNPLDRAVAVFEHARKQGIISPKVSCVEYLTSHPRVQTDGFYAHHLHSFFTYYTSLQMHVIVYEDLVANPLTVMQSLYEFLEVDKYFVPKALAAYAPPPDEPKHRGRISKLIHFVIKLIKRMTARPFVPILPPAFPLERYFTSVELAAFKAAYVTDSTHLTNQLHRDMSVFWNLQPETDAPTVL
jgi:hypothetical protein